MKKRMPDSIEGQQGIRFDQQSLIMQNQMFFNFQEDDYSALQLIDLLKFRQQPTGVDKMINQQAEDAKKISQILPKPAQKLTLQMGTLNQHSGYPKLSLICAQDNNKRLHINEQLQPIRFGTAINESKQQQFLVQPQFRANNLSHNFNSNIFISKDPSKTQKKNTNFIKFVVKHFFDEIKKYYGENTQELPTQIQKIRQQIIDEFCQNRKALSLIFVKTVRQKFYRQFTSNLLRDHRFKQTNILSRHYMRDQNKKQYLLCSKIFSLRCRCMRLAERVETR